MLIKSQSKISLIDKLVNWFILTHHCLVAINCNGLLWYNVTRQIEINWYNNIWYMWYNITTCNKSELLQRFPAMTPQGLAVDVRLDVSNLATTPWNEFNMNCTRNMHVLCRFYGNVMRNTSFDAYFMIVFHSVRFFLMVQWDVFVCFSKIFVCVGV